MRELNVGTGAGERAGDLVMAVWHQTPRVHFEHGTGAWDRGREKNHVSGFWAAVCNRRSDILSLW